MAYGAGFEKLRGVFYITPVAKSWRAIFSFHYETC
jgi:hypothetical protein